MSHVFVGKTSFPLKSSAQLKGALPLPSSQGPQFVLLDGPPYANGAPHLGHVLNKHLKDAVCRAAHLLGSTVHWHPGWDCHGLPLELAVEKMGRDRSDRLPFLSAARAFASQQVDVQKSVFEQQGWCAQWDQSWRTMDPVKEAQTMRVFAQMLERHSVHVRHTAVPWCPQCQSTLSSAEQEVSTSTVETWLVPFELDNNECVLSWTTTPWTVPLHQGLVVSPHALYRALEKDGRNAWVSDDTAPHWSAVCGATVTDRTCWGHQLVGRSYRTPWRAGMVAGDVRVLPAAGTGVLHAVMGLSALDTQVGQDLGWTMTEHLDEGGLVLNSPLSEQNGQPAAQTHGDVLPHMENHPWFAVVPHTMDVAHCWRHHVPLLTRPSRQVFVHLSEETRARAQSMVEQVSFVPATAKPRLWSQMSSRPDWCVSRQRTWGVPLALFLDRRTGQPHARAAHWLRQVATAVEQEGVEAWWSSPSSRWLDGYNEDDVERVDDVLDVWFDSGCAPQFVAPADVVVEGTDQCRGWFQSCLWVAAATNAELPFKQVVCHGFVVDESGEKLSKSKGGDRSNARVAPWNEYPTDVVRVWALMGQEGHDKTWSQATVQLAQKATERLRGLLRFGVANVQDTQPPLDWSMHLPAWDRYWWKQLHDHHQTLLPLFRSGRTGEALQKLMPFAEEFSSVVLSSWKDRLYCALPDSEERRLLNACLTHCLWLWHDVVSVVAPMMAHEVLSFMPARPALQPPSLSDVEMDDVKKVLDLRQQLAPLVERLNATGTPPMKQMVVVPAASWPLVLLADALGVGQCRQEAHVHHVHPEVSTDPFCPRCRRSQPAVHDKWCVVCDERLKQVANELAPVVWSQPSLNRSAAA